jgi:NAD(P)-dependent dehydrogenase (short-subunit alcohol dehydrogenase family)
MGQLDGRVAVITGGGRGIGRAIALRYAAEGARLVVSSRTASDLDEVVAQARAQHGTEGLAVVADGMTKDGAVAPVAAAVERFGSVDVLVCNLGGSRGRQHDPFEPDDGSFEATVLMNLTSHWWTINAALPHMRAAGSGRVVTIGSGAAKRSGGAVAYTTAKHGLVGLTKQLAAAAAPHGITVNCLCPGWTNTSLLDFEAIARRSGTTAEAARERAYSESLQRRVLEPEELTGMAVLLASEDGRGMTGQVVSVDGGYKV